MISETMILELNSSIDKIWQIVTDLEEYTWRTDIKSIEIVEAGKTFIEYSNDNIATTFTITTFIVNERYEFDIDNKNMHGHWSGIFEKTDNGTRLIFKEEIQVKNALMKLIAKKFIKKQQACYAQDLKKVLNEN